MNSLELARPMQELEPLPVHLPNQPNIKFNTNRSQLMGIEIPLSHSMYLDASLQIFCEISRTIATHYAL